MKVSIIGTGYIGLTTGVALAYFGHEVTCVDIDEAKIHQLQAGKIPFYEPWIEELTNLAKANLRFTTQYSSAIPKSDIVFIAVGTPSLPDGSTDLTQVREATKNIGQHLGNQFTVVVNKSTVPIGSGNWVESIILDSLKSREGEEPFRKFAVASNPEFLREGSALADTFFPDRIVVGSDSPEALEIMYLLYKPIIEQSFTAPIFLPRSERMEAVPILTTDLASAELIKYTANAFLSLKISFINEISQLAEKFGADIHQVAKGIGLDSRIGTRFLQAGIGCGGSCFGKDTAALIATAQEYGISIPIVKAAREVNYRQRERVIEKLLLEFKTLKGCTIGLMGMSFKPNTDDIRDAPALDIAQKLANLGANIKAHDPVAMKRVKNAFPELKIEFCERAEQLVIDADALILVTDWPQYRDLPWEELGSQMRKQFVLDGRNYLDRNRIEKAGFKYVGVGR
jgi:UDPglucose 6-dehydrogenase